MRAGEPGVNPWHAGRSARLLVATGALSLAAHVLAGCGFGEGTLAEVDPTSIPDIVTYRDHVAPRMHYYCTGCHSPDGPVTQGGRSWDLSTYEHVVGSYDQIMDAVSSRFMPPGSARKLTPRDEAILERWAELEFPETEEDLP